MKKLKKHTIVERNWDIKRCLLTEKQVMLLFSCFKQERLMVSLPVLGNASSVLQQIMLELKNNDLQKNRFVIAQVIHDIITQIEM